MGDWYRKSEREAAEAFESAPGGLTEAQARERLMRTGRNVLQEGRRESALSVFLSQFQNLPVAILIAAAVISALSGDLESMAVILSVITMNAVLGTLQHQKAQKSLESLKKLSAPRARVRRGGRVCTIAAEEAVPGDRLLLRAGDLVAADARLTEATGLQTDESMLTGESEPAEKQTAVPAAGEALPAAEQRNMVFSGTLVTHGRGEAVVTATGMQTEIGHIASLLRTAKARRTPLQENTDRFGGYLAAGIMLICLAVFGLSVHRGMRAADALMFAVALAVAAIPEALGSVVTIVQAMGTQRMAREHAVIRDLSAVETLGCVSVICSDKTGTLTQNRMRVREVFAGGRRCAPERLSPQDEAQRMLLYAAVLTNDAQPGGKTQAAAGDPTETALLSLAEGAGVSPRDLRLRYPRRFELPFDSERRRMSTLHRVNGKAVLFVKGAPDVLLGRCRRELFDGGVRELAAPRREVLSRMQLAWAGQGLRVLAMAYRELPRDEAAALTESGGRGAPRKDPERDLVWLGMAALMDPPRPETRPAVLAARRAGIRTVMITGDHRVTAEAVAREIGLMAPGDRSVTGAELASMTEEELSEQLPHIAVCARVTPEHKLRIVEAWQRRGAVVAMTGDGVNDAPALKQADIGIAMGRGGTEAARDAASMILADDNFSTIIRAVANGRSVYGNICHAIGFLLSGNLAGILCVLGTVFLSLPLPFAPVQLLFINLLTDSLPALAIGMEPQEEGLLNRPPRSPSEGILTADFLASVLLQGSLLAAGTAAAYGMGLVCGGASCAGTMAFAVLTQARLFHGFNCRGERPLTASGIAGNPWSLLAFGLGTALLAAVLLLPGLQAAFAVTPLPPALLLSAAILSFLPTLVIQMQKIIYELLR